MLGASSTSGLTVSLGVNSVKTTNNACALGGSTVSYKHTGNCVIDATQTGNADYQAAGTVEQTIAVGPATQTVSFSTTAPASATAGGATYTPAATASSGLPVAISLDSTSTGCSQSGGVVSFTGAPAPA